MLSSQPVAQVREEYLIASGARPLHLDVEIAREEFEELIEVLIEGTLQSFDAALSDAGITADQLDNILLVGGEYDAFPWRTHCSRAAPASSR